MTFLISTNLQGQHENHQNKETSTTSGKTLSPHTSAMAIIDGAHIHIDYSSPRVRDRIIFGGLVGYNTVWQAGAHRATWLQTDKDLRIENKILPAGKYGFFVVPGKNKWKIIFNTRWDQHGKDEYDQNEDVLVTEVTPVKLEELQEELEYEITKKENNRGIISLTWENLGVEVPFGVVNKSER